MINWWIYKQIDRWDKNKFEYVLMADDYKIAVFYLWEDAKLFAKEFKLEIKQLGVWNESNRN